MIRMSATVVGVLSLAVAAGGLVARYLPISNDVVLIVAAASPLLSAAGPVAMILFAVVRRWVLTIMAAVLCAVMLLVLMPRFLGPEKSTVRSVSVRLLTANLSLGEADPKAVVALAGDSADVLVLQEMTPGLIAAI